MIRNSRRQLTRSHAGAAISEVPPALFLLIFFAILPVLSFIKMGFSYCACALLNNLELREASRTPHSQLVPTFISVQQNWQSSALGQFVGQAAPPETDVSYYVNGSDTYVIVSTIFTTKSAMNIPYFKGIPGLGAPWTYTITGNRVLEDPSYANF